MRKDENKRDAAQRICIMMGEACFLPAVNFDFVRCGLIEHRAHKGDLKANPKILSHHYDTL